MARKREGLRDLDYQSPKYWEKLLREEGLSMERGTSRRLTYVGGTKTLESIEAAIVSGTDDGQKAKEVTYRNPDSPQEG